MRLTKLATYGQQINPGVLLIQLHDSLKNNLVTSVVEIIRFDLIGYVNQSLIVDQERPQEGHLGSQVLRWELTSLGSCGLYRAGVVYRAGNSRFDQWLVAGATIR